MVEQIRNPVSVAQYQTCVYCRKRMAVMCELPDAYIYECPDCGPDSSTLVFKTELLSTFESEPQYNKEKEKQLISSNDESGIYGEREKIGELLSKYASIFTSRNNLTIYKYFLTQGATFSSEIIDQCNMTESSTHRALKYLTKHNLIQPIVPIKRGKGSGAGPATTVYQIREATGKEIREATNRVMRYQSKYYGFVEQVYQLTLPEVKNQEIQYRKIVNIARKNGSYGYHYTDIANEIARKLQYDGVKIWR